MQSEGLAGRSQSIEIAPVEQQQNRQENLGRQRQQHPRSTHRQTLARPGQAERSSGGIAGSKARDPPLHSARRWKATAMSEQKHFSAAELSKLNTKENVHLLISGKG